MPFWLAGYKNKRGRWRWEWTETKEKRLSGSQSTCSFITGQQIKITEKDNKVDVVIIHLNISQRLYSRRSVWYGTLWDPMLELTITSPLTPTFHPN